MEEKSVTQLALEAAERIGEANGLLVPPEGTCAKHKETHSNCVGCSYFAFCNAQVGSMLNLLLAAIKDDKSYDFVADVDKNMALVKAGIEPIINSPRMR